MRQINLPHAAFPRSPSQRDNVVGEPAVINGRRKCRRAEIKRADAILLAICRLWRHEIRSLKASLGPQEAYSSRPLMNGWRIKRPNWARPSPYYTVLSARTLSRRSSRHSGVYLPQSTRLAPGKRVTEQMSYLLDKSAVEVVQNIAAQTSSSKKGLAAYPHWNWSRAFRGERGFWAITRRPQYHLGGQTETWRWHYRISSRAIPLFCSRRRPLLSPPCVAHD